MTPAPYPTDPRRLVRVEPGIWKRGNRYVVRFRDPHGRSRKRFAATLAEARAVRSITKADVVRGEYRETSRVRFDEYAAQWIASYTGRTSRGIRPETIADYRADLGLDDNGEPLVEANGKRRGAVGFFGRMRLSAIEPSGIKRYAAALHAAGLARNTVRLRLAPVRALLATAYEDGLLRSNPAAGVRVNHADTTEGRQVRALTEDELARLLAAAPDEWRLLVECLAETGLRISECVALTWADVDLEGGRLNVTRRLYQGRMAPPKSRYGVRTVPLSQGIRDELWLLKPGDADANTPVFQSTSGGHLDPSNLFGRMFKPAAKRAGLPWAGFHTLRHTAATRWFRSGASAKQVQMLLGHHSPAFTLATYVHLLPSDLPSPAFLDTLRVARAPVTVRNNTT